MSEETFRYGLPLKGRIPRPKFPLKTIIVERGDQRECHIDENEPVDCVRCGQEFLINTDSAYLIRHPYDAGPYIRCPYCNFKCAAFYYYDRVKRPKPKAPRKIHTPEMLRIPWTKPEE